MQKESRDECVSAASRSATVLTPQYVRDAQGSVLFPDRLLHKLHGRGLAKSAICWISFSLLPPSLLRPLVRLVFFFLLHFITNSDQKRKQSRSQTVYTTRAFLLV